jgi:hypothetical protein
VLNLKLKAIIAREWIQTYKLRYVPKFLLDKITVTEYPLVRNLPFTASSLRENCRPAAHAPYQTTADQFRPAALINTLFNVSRIIFS